MYNFFDVSTPFLQINVVLIIVISPFLFKNNALGVNENGISCLLGSNLLNPTEFKNMFNSDLSF